jgi:hypothetical protein
MPISFFASVATALFAGGEEGRAKLVDDAVERIRRYHVFTDQTSRNLGRTFDDEWPAIRAEAIGANTPAALSVALTRLANAIHDPHVYFNPPTRPTPLASGVEFEVEWVAGGPRFYVARVAREGLGELRPGDMLIAVDGVPATELLERWSTLSNANSPRGVATDIARLLGRKAMGRESVTEGEAVRYTLERRASGKRFSISSVWTRSHADRIPEFALDYDRPSGCLGHPARAYPGYRFVGGGYAFCLYAARDPAHRPFPIVRHVSFLYEDPAVARDDHDALAAQLAQLGRVEGVLLDLRDNRGGNNPNWFLDWYAPKPWLDHRIRFRLHEDLRDVQLRRQFRIDAPWYVRALDAPRTQDGLTEPRPFFCPPGDDDACAWDNRYEPRHRVTAAPVALLVGPGCVSSCDSLAQRFAENRFGPLVGEPSSAGYTTHRVRLPVVLADGSDFGFLNIGFSQSLSGVTGAPIEAVPLPIDVPIERTFDERQRWDALLVDAAIAALRKRR